MADPLADFIWANELGCFLPCCSVTKADGSVCGNGPLTGDQVNTGDCGEDHGSS